MFSKRSVSGQPTSTPTENGVMPGGLSVPAAVVESSQVFGGSTPASSKSATLYQTVDLFAPLNRTPYCVPSTAPTSATDSPKLSTICVAEVSIGWSASCSAKSASSPGWAIAAMSGGLPPSTAVESNGAMLSPADVYLTFTFG